VSLLVRPSSLFPQHSGRVDAPPGRRRSLHGVRLRHAGSFVLRGRALSRAARLRGTSSATPATEREADVGQTSQRGGHAVLARTNVPLSADERGQEEGHQVSCHPHAGRQLSRHCVLSYPPIPTSFSPPGRHQHQQQFSFDAQDAKRGSINSNGGGGSAHYPGPPPPQSATTPSGGGGAPPTSYYSANSGGRLDPVNHQWAAVMDETRDHPGRRKTSGFFQPIKHLSGRGKGEKEVLEGRERDANGHSPGRHRRIDRRALGLGLGLGVLTLLSVSSSLAQKKESPEKTSLAAPQAQAFEIAASPFSSSDPVAGSIQPSGRVSRLPSRLALRAGCTTTRPPPSANASSPFPTRGFSPFALRPSGVTREIGRGQDFQEALNHWGIVRSFLTAQ